MKYWCDECKEEFKRDDLTLISTYPHTYLCAACEDEERLDSTCVTTRKKEQLEAEIKALKLERDSLPTEAEWDALVDRSAWLEARFDEQQAEIEALKAERDEARAKLARYEALDLAQIEFALTECVTRNIIKKVEFSSYVDKQLALVRGLMGLVNVSIDIGKWTSEHEGDGE